MKRKLVARLVPRAFPLRKGKVPPGILQGITGRLLRNSLENERNMTQKREETHEMHRKLNDSLNECTEEGGR